MEVRRFFTAMAPATARLLEVAKSASPAVRLIVMVPILTYDETRLRSMPMAVGCGFRTTASYTKIAYLRLSKLTHSPQSPFAPALQLSAGLTVHRVRS